MWVVHQQGIYQMQKIRIDYLLKSIKKRRSEIKIIFSQRISGKFGDGDKIFECQYFQNWRLSILVGAISRRLHESHFEAAIKEFEEKIKA